jgi:OOP family OmpA-OmpF porin
MATNFSVSGSGFRYQSVWAVVCVVCALGLTGCFTTSTISDKVSNEGVANSVVFPDIERDAWVKAGTFPSLESLQRIQPGMTKSQLYPLIGYPHFKEGFLGVREWDYIFKFAAVPAGGEAVTCQYKVLFDKDSLARSFHWLPLNCEDRIKPQVGDKIESS